MHFYLSNLTGAETSINLALCLVLTGFLGFFSDGKWILDVFFIVSDVERVSLKMNYGNVQQVSVLTYKLV